MSLATKQDYAYCRSLQKFHGKSYFFATLFFPKDLKDATFALYAFFRLPDEIVDNPKHESVDEVRAALADWKDQWERAYQTNKSDHPVLRATVDVFERYNIPFEYSEAFLRVMEQDIDVDRYETYEDLERYMYGSAAVVGLMMSYVIGFSTPEALGYAKKLGEAMQLTNFLRDIDEDYVTRGRIYMPLRDMEAFNVDPEAIVQRKCSEAFRELMRFEAARARALYQEAEKGIPLLDRRGRLAVTLASRLYEAILDELEKQNMDPFAGRASTSLFKKFSILMSVWKKQ